MASNSKAKFFCEFCGTEVAAEARLCPKCGSFFASVRCPQCGKTGTVKDFKKGCPRCHYAMSEEELWGKQGSKNKNAESSNKNGSENRSKKTKVKRPRNLREVDNGTGKVRRVGDGSPTWLFFTCIAVIAIILVVLFIRCQ